MSSAHSVWTLPSAPCCARLPVPLTPKAYEVLLALVRRAGHIVEKDELMRDIWADAFVEEGNLTHHIFTLRKALGEGSNGCEYIETIPRRGYRITCAGGA